MWPFKGEKAPTPIVPGGLYIPLPEPLRSYEESFNGKIWIDAARAHAEVPIFAVTLYLVVVFYVPQLLQDRPAFNLRKLFAGWNLLLSAFSIIGALRTVPHLLDYWSKHGFKATVCTTPVTWYRDGPVGLWVGLFIFSKIPELLDTFFLVFQKKRVIFLHWFHHVTVMLYCWHAYHTVVAPGLWFAAMNYSVHAIMYFYYFAMAAKLSWLVAPIAPFITTIQILQMAVGSFVTLTSASEHWSGGFAQCQVDPANYKMGLAMYGSYFALFSVLFYDKYYGKKKGSQATDARKICGVKVGQQNVDTAGRFEDFSNRNSGSGSPTALNAEANGHSNGNGYSNGDGHHMNGNGYKKHN